MAYTKTVWQDRIVQYPMCFTFASVNGGTQLTPNEGTVTQAGTPISASTMNNIENGLESVEARVTTAETNITGKVAKTGDTMTGNLTAPVVNGSTNLQEAGVNLVSKYLQLSGGTLSGTLTVSSGVITTLGATLRGNGTSAILSSTNATMFLRPGGDAVTTGQTTIDTTGKLDATSLSENGTLLSNKYMQLSGGTFTGTVTGTTINATANLQEAGTNLSAKYLKLDGSNAITGQLVVNRNGFNIIAKGTASGTSNLAFLEIQDSAGTSQMQIGATATGNLNGTVRALTGDLELTTNSGVVKVTDDMTVTGLLTTNGTIGHVKTTAGALIYARSSADDSQIRMITTATDNYVQSGNDAFNTAKNMRLTGANNTTMSALIVNATTTTLQGGLSVTGTSSLTGDVTIKGDVNVVDSLGNSKPFLVRQDGDATGFGIALGSGGKVVIGSGESYTAVLTDASTSTGQTEQTYVTSDNDIQLWSNVQSGVASKHELKYDKTGKLTADGDLIYEPTPTWTNITLQNGATVNNSRTPRYMKRNGVVYVQGEIGTVADGTVIGTLPVGYRHNNGTGMNFITAIANGGATTITALVSVGSNGQITVINKTGGNGSPICFSGITFPADQ